MGHYPIKGYSQGAPSVSWFDEAHPDTNENTPAD